MHEQPSNCPFCASPEVMLCEQPIDPAKPRMSHYVACIDCFARGSQMLDEAKAVARWNSVPRPVAKVAANRRVIRALRKGASHA